VFRAVVDVLAQAGGGGFRDDDGVWHPGPTRADAILADKVLRAMGGAK
jgi:hypothetical protein